MATPRAPIRNARRRASKRDGSAQPWHSELRSSERRSSERRSSELGTSELGTARREMNHLPARSSENGGKMPKNPPTAAWFDEHSHSCAAWLGTARHEMIHLPRRGSIGPPPTVLATLRKAAFGFKSGSNDGHGSMLSWIPASSWAATSSAQLRANAVRRRASDGAQCSPRPPPTHASTAPPGITPPSVRQPRSVRALRRRGQRAFAARLPRPIGASPRAAGQRRAGERAPASHERSRRSHVPRAQLLGAPSSRISASSSSTRRA